MTDDQARRDAGAAIFAEDDVARCYKYWIALTDCDILEASTPELDDVVRIEDDFGREGTTNP